MNRCEGLAVPIPTNLTKGSITEDVALFEAVAFIVTTPFSKLIVFPTVLLPEPLIKLAELSVITKFGVVICNILPLAGFVVVIEILLVIFEFI